MTQIFLTAQEKQLFDALPETVRNGWQTMDETLGVSDSPEKRKMRLQLLRLHDPTLQDFLSKAQAAGSSEELAGLLQEMTLKDIADGDVEELFFALGPDALSMLIAAELKDVQTDDDLEGVVALTVIRHSLLSAMQPLS